MNLRESSSINVPREQRECDEHGAYEACGYAGGRHWTGCPQCADERHRQGMEAHERERHAARRRELVEQSGIRGRFLQASLQNYEVVTDAQQRVLRACRSFIDEFPANEGGGLLLLGRPGTGKTHLASAMSLSVIARHLRSAHVTTATEIVRQLRNTWRRGSGEREEDVIERYAGFGLLVIDEADAGFGSDAERVQLLEVIDARYKLQAPIVACSNLNTTELRQAMGERSFDRLSDGARVLTLAWESHRRRAG